ncbi:MAG: c-type cytochrome domain-containing protein, partial [Aureliella sp.]
MHYSRLASTARVSVWVIAVCWLSMWAGGLARADEAAPIPPETTEWFEREVRPLLAEHCLSCHSSGLEAPKANLKLDRRDFLLAGGDSGPAIELGKPDESLLMQAVRGEGLEMPPDKPLSKQDQAKLERWIRIGAPWPEMEAATPASGPDWLVARARSHWAWQPMRQSDTPQVKDASWPARPLDAFILKRLEELELSPVDSASPTSLLRRLAFDLTGLPPSPADAAEF